MDEWTTEKKLLGIILFRCHYIAQACIFRVLVYLTRTSAKLFRVFYYFRFFFIHILNRSLHFLLCRWYIHVGIVMPERIGVRLKMTGELHEAEMPHYKLQVSWLFILFTAELLFLHRTHTYIFCVSSRLHNDVITHTQSFFFLAKNTWHLLHKNTLLHFHKYRNLRATLAKMTVHIKRLGVSFFPFLGAVLI